MSIAKLDKNNHIVINANSAINYVTQDGLKKTREPKTAALDMIREATIVQGYQVGTVTANFKQYGQWETYFVNQNVDTGAITLRPASEPDNRDKFVYVNPIANQKGKHYLGFNEMSEAGRLFVQGLSVKEWQKEPNAEKIPFVEGRICLKNDELKQTLIESQGCVAVLSKNGIEICNEERLREGAKEVSKSIEKEIGEEKAPSKTKAKEMEM